MFRYAFAAFVAVVYVVSSGWALAQDYFTASEIRSVTPRASDDLVSALVANQQFLREARINSRMRVAHFLAQVMTETGGLRRLDENMNYSAERLIQVFSRRTISVSKAHELHRKPVDIANWVYGNRLGNRGRDTMDGWNYRGSGYIQLTGRDNFLRRGSAIGMSLADHPDLAREPVAGLKAATAYWTARQVNAAADINDRPEVRRLVNGPAQHGLNAAIIWFNRIWIDIFQDKPSFGTELAWVESNISDISSSTENAAKDILADLGFLSEIEADAPNAYVEALQAFQESRGLMPTGELDEDTLYAITDPNEWRIFEDWEFATAPLITPDSTASHTLGDRTQVQPRGPFEGSGEETLETLSAGESAEFAAATETYAQYELVHGRYQGDTFTPFTVIGEDERLIVEDTRSFPSRAIVQIIIQPAAGSSARSLCSGALIAPNLVLTAGHCVHSGTARGKWYYRFNVIPARNTNAAPYGTCRAEKTYALSGWVSASTNAESRDYDLGAIRLNCEVGQHTGWFGIRPLADDEVGVATRVQGYAGDRNRGRQLWSAKSLVDLSTLKGFYQMDTAGGMSGSPIFTEGENVIFCVHTNGLHNGIPYSENNACTRITVDRLLTITDWINE